jgi:tetratricopeptide (TPR) repeat protein
VADARTLLQKGDLEAALARLQEAPDDPESLYVQGRVWAKKAETAPLPAAAPPPSPLPRGWEPPPVPELKDEEIRAAELFERAIAARPADAAPHLALAELLAPHAAHQYDLAQEAARKRRPAHVPPATPPPAVDATPDRVIRAYQFAIQADPKASGAVDALIRFGRRVGRLDAVESGLKEQIARTKEAQSVDALIRYGDFLVTEKKAPEEAIDQYRQALIWRADDEATRMKLADIHIRTGADYFARQQYALAEASFKEAARWAGRTSAQAGRVASYQARLNSIRRPQTP